MKTLWHAVPCLMLALILMLACGDSNDPLSTVDEPSVMAKKPADPGGGKPDKPDTGVKYEFSIVAEPTSFTVNTDYGSLDPYSYTGGKVDDCNYTGDPPYSLVAGKYVKFTIHISALNKKHMFNEVSVRILRDSDGNGEPDESYAGFYLECCECTTYNLFCDGVSRTELDLDLYWWGQIWDNTPSDEPTPPRTKMIGEGEAGTYLVTVSVIRTDRGWKRVFNSHEDSYLGIDNEVHAPGYLPVTVMGIVE